MISVISVISVVASGSGHNHHHLAVRVVPFAEPFGAAAGRHDVSRKRVEIEMSRGAIEIREAWAWSIDWIQREKFRRFEIRDEHPSARSESSNGRSQHQRGLLVRQILKQPVHPNNVEEP